MRSTTELLQAAHQHQAAGQTAEAESICRRILQREPYCIEALLFLGHAARSAGRWDEALEQFQKAVHIAPENPAAHYAMTAALHAASRLEAAARACHRVIELRPDFGGAYTNLGAILAQMGMQREAIEFFRRGAELAPSDPYAHSNLLYALFFVDGAEPAEILSEHVRWDERHARPLAGALPPPANDRSADRPLRVGYVSADFREHPVAYFFEPLLKCHNRDRYTITCYSAGTHRDGVTERLCGLADAWREIAPLTDEQAAAQIREDQIDILVDLSGHTSGHRLLVFARRPAPVQISYLGYPGTTGMRAIDYRLSDAQADPPGMTDAHYSERLLRVEGSAWCYQPPEDAPETRARGERPITFASFNRMSKITPAGAEVWARILAAVPESRLLIKSEGLHEPAPRQRVLEFFTSAIAPDRIEIIGRVDSVQAHLDLYNRVDVALDTFPYNGTTTTCEALWMGVPVIALAGQTHASRVGASLLKSAGLPELIAASVDDYVERACALAREPARVAELRRSLRSRISQSRLTDTQAHARAVEAAYQSAWRHWCE